jgi:hypothetical protein
VHARAGLTVFHCSVDLVVTSGLNKSFATIRGARLLSLYAIYVGDMNYGGARSSTLTQNVNLIAANITLSSSANPSTVGQTVTFTARVTPSTGYWHSLVPRRERRDWIGTKGVATKTTLRDDDFTFHI